MSHVGGYLDIRTAKAPDTFNAGYSMYVAAWPLLGEYPGNRFQTGLFGTWMHPQRDEPKRDRRIYSDIEGGLGWWRDTRFATTTPKFIMGGVALNFVAWANGPGAGKGRSWEKPAGKYAVAQLSPWVLWPPDGLNLKQGTCGELIGYGYLPLPLIDPKATTAGADVPTGGNCWTLFMNTANFKGPVAFFTPYFFSAPTVDAPELAGEFLDAKPSSPNRPVAMETQYIPCAQAAAGDGQMYARVAPTSFPRAADGASVVAHRMVSYSRAALWDAVAAWFDGGPPASGAIDPAGTFVKPFPGEGRSSWRIYARRDDADERIPLDWSSFATSVALDEQTFGFRWDSKLTTAGDSGPGPLVTIPEYYRLDKNADGEPLWVVADPAAVPAETGLADACFTGLGTGPGEGPTEGAYVTPDDPASSWKTPGPVAGPFEARPGDGTVVTYSWYRFADQPAMLNADLTDTQREAVQQRVEQLHRHWTADRDYLAPPATGDLADIDPALIVTPPKGLEVGYVPIATRQEAG